MWVGMCCCVVGFVLFVVCSLFFLVWCVSCLCSLVRGVAFSVWVAGCWLLLLVCADVCACGCYSFV